VGSPQFINGVLKVKTFEGRIFELRETTWFDHILKDRSREYLRDHFDKILETLKEPDYILQSPAEGQVVSYVKYFTDFRIWNTVTAMAYLYVLVNLSTDRIRTIYTNVRLKGWHRLWPKK